MARVTLHIPVYNEEENLLPLEELLLKFLSEQESFWKVVFINDGSEDRSLERIKEICGRNGAFSYVSSEENSGLDKVLYAGFQSVSSEWTAYMDSDLQVKPEDFEKLLPFISDYDLISGQRFRRQDSMVKKATSHVANKFRRLFTGDKATDSGCPMKLIRTSVLREIPYFPGFHRFLPALAESCGGRTIEVPINHYPRMAGHTKFGISNRLWEGILGCFRFLRIKKKLRKKVKVQH